MNHDDTFNPDSHSNPAGGGNLPPELEARVVAWVLGEASAFEAAELERLCAERPELAVFRRRIAAVHGLVGEAVRPTKEPLRLSPERRAKLLAVIGSPTAKPQTVTKPARPRFAWRSWAMPMAACLALMFGLSSMMIPSFSRVRETARRSVEASEARQREMAASMEVSGGTLQQAPMSTTFASTMPEPSSAVLGRDDKSTGEADSTVHFDMPVRPMSGTFAVVAGPTATAPTAKPAPAPRPPRPDPSSTVLGYAGGDQLRSPSSYGVPEPAPAEEKPAAVMDANSSGLYTDSASVSAPSLSVRIKNEMPSDYVYRADRAATGLAKDKDSDRPSAGWSIGRTSAVSLESQVLSDELYVGPPVSTETIEQSGVRGLVRGSVSITAGTPQVFGTTGLPAGSIKATEAEKAEIRSRLNTSSSSAVSGDGFAPAPQPAERELADQKDRAAMVSEVSSSWQRPGAYQEKTKSSESWDSPNQPRRKRTTFSITAGTPQTIENIEFTDADKAEIARRIALRKTERLKKKLSGPGLEDTAQSKPTFDEKTAKWMGFDSPEDMEDNFAVIREFTAEIKAIEAKADLAVSKQLQATVIPSVNFKNLPLSKVLSTLTSVSEEYDSTNGTEPQNFVFEGSAQNDPDVSVTFRNLSVGRMLDFITQSVGYTYEVRGNSVVVFPGQGAKDLVTRTIPISRETLEHLIGPDIDEANIDRDLRRFFESAGIGKSPGLWLHYGDAALTVTQTKVNMERLLLVLKRYEPKTPEKFDESLRRETTTTAQPVSTFSLHVSDASYRLACAAIGRGELPDPTTIRPEEFYNAFDYGDPAPVAGEPVACRVEQSAHPFLQQRNLVRIAMKVPAAGRSAAQPLRLTVLLDTSGSMEREDRAATVRAALGSLASLLGPNDRVTLIGFARTPRLLAFGLPGQASKHLVELAAQTPAEGGTNLEEALRLAGEQARALRLDGAQNRIVLLTDGAANLGNADPARLAESVEALRRAGIAFDACGVVADGLDDGVLETLTRKGDGRYAVLNSPEEADANFARQLAGAFRPAAKDVKVQVRFNPARVASWRLIGFEQHRLKTEDFRDNKVDAAELAAEEAANALYQVQVLPEGEGELGEVFVRFLDPSSGLYVERSWTLSYDAQAPVFAKAAPAMRLAGSAAFLAEKLRGGELAGQVRLDEFAPVVNGLGTAYPGSNRVLGFIELFRQTRRVLGE